MRILLMLLVSGLYVADIFAVDIHVAPGLSLKNALLNILAFALAVRYVIRPGTFTFQMPSLQIVMGIWLGYAIITYMVLGLVLNFHNYDLLASAVLLKGGLLDYFVIFAVFFYGSVTNKDAVTIVKVLLIGLILANAASLISATGVVVIGENVLGEEGEEAGRVFGAFGHANETAAMTDFLFPAVLAVAAYSRGAVRLGWIGGAIICIAMQVMSGSRGGYAALVFGGLWGLYVARRYVSFSRVAIYTGAFLLIVTPILAVLQLKFDVLPIARLIETILHPAHHGADRGDIWAPVVQRMMESPWTLFSGFGWNSYAGMGFYFVTHNHYLSLWFELGLVGVGCYLFLMWRTTSYALSAASVASGENRALLAAFAVGIPILLVAITFSLLFKPWLYIWAYIGVIMRLACNLLEENKVARRAQRAAASPVAIPNPALRRPLRTPERPGSGQAY